MWLVRSVSTLYSGQSYRCLCGTLCCMHVVITSSERASNRLRQTCRRQNSQTRVEEGAACTTEGITDASCRLTLRLCRRVLGNDYGPTTIAVRLFKSSCWLANGRQKNYLPIKQEATTSLDVVTTYKQSKRLQSLEPYSSHVTICRKYALWAVS